MGTFFFNIIVYPIELLVEFIYVFFFKSFENSGLAIACISIVINVLALPLYNIADKLQRRERDVRIKLKPGVDRIKAAFKGDEQYMILSTYYRQNHYHPAYALRSSISLMIQIPFFIAAYHFLSHLQQLQGQSFLFLADLGKPDGLLTIGERSFNVLPMVMTVINVIAGIIYTKGFPARDKIQLYSMAGLFMILLYNSPAGLVYYWTLNNIFSLLKNCFYRFKQPLKIFYFCALGSMVCASAIILYKHPTLSLLNIAILVFGCFFVMAVPVLVRLINMVYNQFLSVFSTKKKQRNSLFIVSCILLWLLCGLFLPANLISSSPIEFSFTGIVDNPLNYVFTSMIVCFGIFCLWPFVIYSLANDKMKTIFACLFSIFALIALANSLLFKGDYGMVSSLLEFNNPSLLESSFEMNLMSFFVLLFFCSLALLIIKWNRTRILMNLYAIIVVALITTGGYACWKIHGSFYEYKRNLQINQQGSLGSDDMKPVFHLSKNGKNVVVLFVDSAISSYFPTILEQFPELVDQFKGFVFYPNTASFGNNTISGSPAMLGGYEYTPEEINKRDSEKLVSKHNESLLVVPRIFLDAGYQVTVTDPPWSNYRWTGDYSQYKSYPDIQIENLIGKYSVRYKNEHKDVLSWEQDAESSIIKKRLPVFSLFKILFPVLRSTLYDHGDYFLVNENPQNTDEFLDSYSLLYYLDQITDYEGKGNTYTFIANDAAHSPVLLQGPDYVPQTEVSNIAIPYSDVFELSTLDYERYHVNAASIKRIGVYLQKLQEDGVYDNTRIIVVADHGQNIFTTKFNDFIANNQVYSYFNPLLLVKDFEAQGDLATDNTLMTNADAPLMALEGLDVSRINPFTGIDMFGIQNKEELHVFSCPWAPERNNANTLVVNELESFTVHDDLSVESNWNPINIK